MTLSERLTALAQHIQGLLEHDAPSYGAPTEIADIANSLVEIAKEMREDIRLSKVICPGGSDWVSPVEEWASKIAPKSES